MFITMALSQIQISDLKSCCFTTRNNINKGELKMLNYRSKTKYQNPQEEMHKKTELTEREIHLSNEHKE